MVFWIGPVVQTPFRVCATKRRLLSRGFHSTLRAFAPGTYAPLRDRPCVSALIQKTSSPSATLYAIRIAATLPSKLGQVFLKWGMQEISNYEDGGWEEKKRYFITAI